MILFPSWATTKTGQFVGAWIGFFLMALLYEGLKFYREILAQKEAEKHCSPGTKRSMR